MIIIGHLDMDAFFASVEERENPRWKGMPIVVGADPHSPAGEGRGRGVVSTANYPARAYGIHSAMPIGRAWSLGQIAKRQGKPEPIFLPGNYELYSKISHAVMDIVRRYAPAIEQASVDEAYFNLTQFGNYLAAAEIAQKIKAEVLAKENLTCSIGLGPNKLIAKIASGKNKPDGLTVVRPEEVIDFLAPLSVRELPGVGPKTGKYLAKKGIHYIHQLRNSDETELKPLAYGIGSTEIVEERTAKSIGEQETFAEDTLNSTFINKRLSALADQVIQRFQTDGFGTFRTVVVTLRFADFQTFTRSHTLKQPTKDDKILKREALKLLLPFLDHRQNPKHKPIRLVGVRIEKLV